MAKKKSAETPKLEDVPDLEKMMEDLTDEERCMFAVVEGFSKLLDETFPEGMTLYDVVTVQRLVNTFLMDFVEDMHDGEVTELVDEIMELSCEPVEAKPAPKAPKKAAKKPAKKATKKK